MIASNLRRASTTVRRRALPALVCGLLAWSLSAGPALAQNRSRGATAPTAPAAAPSQDGGTATLPGGSRTYQLSLKQLGAQFPFQLRGVQGSNGVPFSIRNDEIVTGAKLRLNYAYSPALISELSHINVLVNGEVAASIPVPKDQAGTNQTREINLPTRLITEFNRLNVELIGHYTMECEDPAHSSLWANISNNSVIELTVSPIALENDLALLPQPFFDRRDVRRLTLPFVFAAAPANGTLEAAGTMASWFGALAGYRGATFPNSQGQVPDSGNAVVFALGNERLPGVQWPSVQGPTLSVVPNPNDPRGKLLLVLGRDANDLKMAATTLTVGGATLSGQTATITQFTTVKPRKPYDAPNWLSTERPIKFGELAEQTSLNVSGYSPDLIRINLRLPPDLFGWRSKGIPIDLKYRYTPRPTPDKSTLNVNMNQQFLRALPLFAAQRGATGEVDRLLSKILPDGTVPAHAKFNVPLFMLPSQSQLQFHYYYDLVKQGYCKDVVLDNVKGAIEPDSTIDISGFSHFIAMPDLAAFGNSGFPFTRMADLSDTAVILPDSPSPADYSAYLTLMGRMGDSTGYPATGVTVTQAATVQSVENKDLLVIGSGGNQPLQSQWSKDMPIGLDGNTKRFQVSDLVYRAFNWWNPDDRDNALPHRNEMVFSSNSTDAVIVGFESPLSGGRSVVLISSNRPAGLYDAVNALLDTDLVKRIQGSVAVVRGKQVDSVVAEQTYYVGSLNPILHARWFLSSRPLLLMLLGVISAILLAAVLYLSLRARAKKRLS